jgi:hypothetical protein
MAHPRYGCITANAKTTEYPCNADEVWHHDGANVCLLDGSGYITQALGSSGTVFGYANVPKGMGAGSATASWKAGDDGVDKIAVFKASDGYEFLLPSNNTITVAMAGNAADIVNDSATDTTASLVDTATTTDDIFIIQGRGVDRVAGSKITDVVVRFNPSERQADT